MCVCAMFLVLVSDSDPSPSHSSRRLRQHGWREPTPNGGSSRKREGHPSSRRRPRTPRCGHRPHNPTLLVLVPRDRPNPDSSGSSGGTGRFFGVATAGTRLTPVPSVVLLCVVWSSWGSWSRMVTRVFCGEKGRRPADDIASPGWTGDVVVRCR